MTLRKKNGFGFMQRPDCLQEANLNKRNRYRFTIHRTINGSDILGWVNQCCPSTFNIASRWSRIARSRPFSFAFLFPSPLNPIRLSLFLLDCHFLTSFDDGRSLQDASICSFNYSSSGSFRTSFGRL